MQCAVTAAGRGHRVQLWERDERLGGAYYTASLPPGKRIYQSLIAWYEQELARLGVPVRLGTEGTVAGVAEAAPEVVVLATGARNRTLADAGISGQADGSAAEVLRQRPDLTEPVVVIGGDVSGAETAHFLAALGYDVVLPEKEAEIGRHVTPAARHFLLAALQELGVVVHTMTTVTAVEPGLVRAGPREFACGSVVSALGRTADVGWSEPLGGCDVHVIGDAARPWHAQAAIYAGAELGRRI